MNNICISGNLATDVTTNTAGSTKFARFRLAVQRPYAKKGEKPKTDFFDVSTSGVSADFAVNYLTKGKGCEVIGSLQTDNYEKDGKTIYRTYINASRVGFCPSGAGFGAKNASAPAAAPAAAAAPAPAADPFGGGFDDPFGGDSDPFSGMDLPFGG